jgi:CheY-like chemotaxis protein
MPEATDPQPDAARGLVHDLGNVLLALGWAAAALERRPDLTAEARHDVRQIRELADQAASLLRSLRDSGGRSEGEPAERAGAAAVLGGTSILLVEDDPAVRRLLARALSAAGCRVLEAADAAAALAQVEGEAATLDLLVSDLLMPGQGGAELAAEVAARRPGVRVLLISGRTAGRGGEAGSFPRGMHFLAKPFSPAELVAKIRLILGR